MSKHIPINFFKEDVVFRLLHQEKLKRWIAGVIKEKKYFLVQINYIFCSDEYLLQLNKQYLRHNTYTDIITFNNSSAKKKVEADIFISYQRIEINATKFNSSTEDELHRVMIHGVLHLLGYKDKSAKDQRQMRITEDQMRAILNPCIPIRYKT